MECTANHIRLILPPRQRKLVPCNLPLDRVWRWCILSSLRDLRLSRAHGHVVSLPNLQRLFARRWHEACRLHDITEQADERVALCVAGAAAVQEGYQRLCRQWWSDGWVDAEDEPTA